MEIPQLTGLINELHLKKTSRETGRERLGLSGGLFFQTLDYISEDKKRCFASWNVC